MFNPTWLYTGVVYAGAVWLARRGGIDLPKRIAVFFYALVFVHFYPTLTQDAVNTSVGFLWADPVREAWRSWTPPLWNPFSGAGSPLLANPQSSALSPLRILGLPLSLAHSLSFEAAMKVLIALTFTFLWCRRRGCSEIASATGAVVFGFSMSLIGGLHFPLITTACLAPAVFFGIDLLAERVTYARFVALSLIGAAMLFGGQLEAVLYTAILATLYALWRRPRVLVAIAGAAVVAVLLAAPLLAPFIEAKRYQAPGSDWPTIGGFAGIAAWLIVAVLAARAIDLFTRDRLLVQMLLLVAIIAGSWIATRDRSLVAAKTPLVRALDDLAKKEKAPFRITGSDATPYPGYEDVRVDDTMANGRYAAILSNVVDFEHPLLDYLNVRYMIGPDGRIFENAEVLPRFFAVRNVVIDFRDASFANRLKEHRDWGQTALIESLDVEAPQQRDDFFQPRPADAPVAVAEIRDAKPAGYRIHVRAPRWSLVVSSIPWWPGWKVERNGARIEPIRVNGAFLGFAVPPGQLDARVWYDPWTFRAGAIISAATLAALVAYGVRRKPMNS